VKSDPLRAFPEVERGRDWVRCEWKLVDESRWKGVYIIGEGKGSVGKFTNEIIRSREKFGVDAVIWVILLT
jgi:hypothetical protein